MWLGGALSLQAEFNLTGPAYLEGSGGRYSSFVEETVRTTEGWSRWVLLPGRQPNGVKV